MEYSKFNKHSDENKSCYAKANMDEPVFVLLGRDPAMAEAIQTWIQVRQLCIDEGVLPDTPEERAHIVQAREMVEAVLVYQESQRAGSKQQAYRQARAQHVALYSRTAKHM